MTSMPRRCLTEDEQTRVTTRLRLLLAPHGGPVMLPPGVKATGVDHWSANVELPWSSPWLRSTGGEPVSEVPLRWGEGWSEATVDAAADPDTPDADLARLVIQDLAASAARSVIHEFIEFATVHGVKLWDAHPPMEVGVSMTPHILARLAEPGDI